MCTYDQINGLLQIKTEVCTHRKQRCNSHTEPVGQHKTVDSVLVDLQLTQRDFELESCSKR